MVIDISFEDEHISKFITAILFQLKYFDIIGSQSYLLNHFCFRYILYVKQQNESRLKLMRRDKLI